MIDLDIFCHPRCEVSERGYSEDLFQKTILVTIYIFISIILIFRGAFNIN
jgi:hypothetical protein